MKKLIYISILSIMVLFTSCFEDKDNWYSETSSYDGRYVVAQSSEESDDDTVIEDGNELMIYNSAADIENEIIIDFSIAGNPVKGKFNVSGTSANFSTSGTVVKNLSRTVLEDDDYSLTKEDGTSTNNHPSDLETPTVAGTEYTGIQIYARLSLEEGKVIPEGATTIGGNVSDSVYVKVTAYHDYLIIESYQLPEDEWDSPETPKFGWRVKDGSRTNADGKEEHWTLSGYRYTGLPEDI